MALESRLSPDGMARAPHGLLVPAPRKLCPLGTLSSPRGTPCIGSEVCEELWTPPQAALPLTPILQGLGGWGFAAILASQPGAGKTPQELRGLVAGWDISSGPGISARGEDTPGAAGLGGRVDTSLFFPTLHPQPAQWTWAWTAWRSSTTFG